MPKKMVLEDRMIRRYSTNFGNFVADVIRGMPLLRDPRTKEAELGLINSGCFRLGRDILENENVTDQTLCEIFFYANSVRLFEMSGRELSEILRKCLQLRLENEEEGHGNFLQISGITVEVRGESIEAIEIVSAFGRHRPLDSNRNYKVATTDYVAYESEYNQWFKNKTSEVLIDDLAATVRLALKNLREENESLYQVTELLLDDRPRWVWDTRKDTNDCFSTNRKGPSRKR